METHDIVGKRILITGDVNTGKTTLERNIMNLLFDRSLSSRIAIIDMAPDIPEEIAAKRGLQGVGGKLMPSGRKDVLYLTTPIRPPRLLSRTGEEALSIAMENKIKIDDLLSRFQQAGKDILFINDVSMYLQAGNARELLQWIQKTQTVIANGYYGHKLGTGAFSAKEATEMEILIASFPYHVKMPGPSLDDILNIGSPGRK
jgi:hypothetical protein